VFDHVTIRASDPGASEGFYDCVLGALGLERTTGEHFVEWGDFSIASATDGPTTQRLHVGFVAPSRDVVDEFWRAGVAAGYVDDGEPGLRPEYSAEYYGAFLLDPDRNSAEAVHHADTHERSSIDHVWMRVSDVEASRRFYDVVAPFAGYENGTEHDGLSRSVGTGEASRSSPDLRRATPTSPSRPRRTQPSTPSTPPRPPRGSVTTARRASGRSTTRATTERSCSIRTGTTSRSSITTAAVTPSGG